MLRLNGRVALVAGSGAAATAAARALAREGAQLALAHRGGTREQVDASVRAIGGLARHIPLDPSSETHWNELGEVLLRDFGRLDVLVLCLGASLPKPIAATSLAEFQQLNAQNVEGVFLGLRKGVALMRASAAAQSHPVGSIVNVVALPTAGMQDAAAYWGSQGAVRILSKSVAVECGTRRDLIRVNTIHAPGVHTPEPRGLEDIANAIVYFASDESRLVTGAEIVIGGSSSAL